MMRGLLRSSTGAVLVLAIMFIGSLVLWVGTPLAVDLDRLADPGRHPVRRQRTRGDVRRRARVGRRARAVLVKLSGFYRANRRARGLDDPGHGVLELVLIVSAAVTLVAFAVWFVFLAGANPVPGMEVSF